MVCHQRTSHPGKGRSPVPLALNMQKRPRQPISPPAMRIVTTVARVALTMNLAHGAMRRLYILVGSLGVVDGTGSLDGAGPFDSDMAGPSRLDGAGPFDSDMAGSLDGVDGPSNGKMSWKRRCWGRTSTFATAAIAFQLSMHIARATSVCSRLIGQHCTNGPLVALDTPAALSIARAASGGMSISVTASWKGTLPSSIAVVSVPPTDALPPTVATYETVENSSFASPRVVIRRVEPPPTRPVRPPPPTRPVRLPPA
jgi:hypothetical protein